MKKEGSSDHIKQIVLKDCADYVGTKKNDKKNAEVIIEKTILETERFSRALWRFYDELIAHHSNIENYFSPGLLLSIIVHLRKIVNMRIENRNLDVNIVIFTGAGKKTFFSITHCSQRPFVI